MAKSVVIVESVAKTKTIKKFLGNNYQVLSSVGHIKDLPKRSFGIDIEDRIEFGIDLLRNLIDNKTGTQQKI